MRSPRGGRSRAPTPRRVGEDRERDPDEAVVPIFSRIPASSTEPTVGASVWASGSQVWNGHIGTLMAKPRNRPAKISIWTVRVKPPSAREPLELDDVERVRRRLKYMARKPSSMNTLPNSVYRKNLSEAYWRLAEPQTAIMKYIGTRTSSQNTKNRIRSKAMNVPAIPVSSSSIRARTPSACPGRAGPPGCRSRRGRTGQVSSNSGRLMPSIPTWYGRDRRRSRRVQLELEPAVACRSRNRTAWRCRPPAPPP